LSAGIAIFLISLDVVVGFAEELYPTIETGAKPAGAPTTVVGISFVILVLILESYAADRVTGTNRL